MRAGRGLQADALTLCPAGAALLQARPVLVEGRVQREGPPDASQRQFQVLAKGRR